MIDKRTIETDANGTRRFKGNAIVTFLLDAGPFDMNALALMPWAAEDRAEFAMLIGYSVNGFGSCRTSRTRCGPQ